MPTPRRLICVRSSAWIFYVSTAMAHRFPFPDPRVRGIREQHYRAKWLLKLALRTKKRSRRFRLLILAMYPARGVAELMLEAAEKQELKAFHNADPKQSREAFEDRIVPKLPFYRLIEKLRIHDFHRFGCVPPNPRIREFFFGGPMKLVARKGRAVLTGTQAGPKIITTGKSTFKDQRSLCNTDGHFFDAESGKFHPLEEILSSFLEAVPAVITDFERLAAG